VKRPGPARLTRRSQFLAVQNRGDRAFSGAVLVLTLGCGQARARLGITVSSRVAGAVVRNKIKRRVREAFRAVAEELPPVDVVVIARRGADELSVEGIKDALRSVVRRPARRGVQGGASR
jgi:ribonuclease P protein component